MDLQLIVLFVSIGSISTVDNPGRAKGLAIGSKAVVLEPKSAKSSVSSPGVANNSLQLWCQMVSRSLGGPKMRISRAEWSKFPHDLSPLRDAVRVVDFEQAISSDGLTASLLLSYAPVTAAGKYRCDLWDEFGDFYTTGNIFVHMRPVGHLLTPERLKLDDEEHAFSLSGPGKTISEGASVSLHCSFLAHPLPVYQWLKDGQPIVGDKGVELSKDSSELTLNEATFDDQGEYKCVARNQFSSSGITSRYNATLQYQIRIKDQLAWLWPLLVILAIAILLVFVIAVCEFRRLRKERQRRVRLEPEEDD